MKKKIILAALIAVITTGAAFADYPKGWGVGLFAGFSEYWESGHVDSANWGFALKAPQLPIFWGIALELDRNYSIIGVRGDHYLIHNNLIKEINLHWYIGIGGWLWLWLPRHGNFGFSLGARVPIGLSWQPVDLLEIFLELAPAMGLRVTPNFHFPIGGLGASIGFRLWF
jgi:hypothetical protein